MDVWMPKLGFTYPRVAVVDGFASAGRYRDNTRGSPLLMLDAYVGRAAADRARFDHPPHFVFIERERRFARHLSAEVEAYTDLHGAEVDVIHGTYESVFPKVVDFLAGAYRQPVPTFAFVDPRGYGDNPFSHIADFRRRMPNKSEVMVYLPASFMARFIATGTTDAALTKLYGGLTWEQAKEIDESSRKLAGAKLADLFGNELGRHFDWVTSFNVEPERRNDYYLMFGTGHKDGLRAMKQGMWSVDRGGGKGFRQAKTRPGQDQLFKDDSYAAAPDTTVLGGLLYGEFGERVFAVEQAEDFTLFRTKFLDRPHLRSWALRPLEKSGHVEVVESSRRRMGDYPVGTKLRFRAPPANP